MSNTTAARSFKWNEPKQRAAKAPGSVSGQSVATKASSKTSSSKKPTVATTSTNTANASRGSGTSNDYLSTNLYGSR